MDNNNSPFIEAFPNHEHRRLYILLLVLLFVIIAGGFVLYQTWYSTRNDVSKDTRTEEERVIAENKELVRLSDAMKDAGLGQKTLTESELNALADKFNKTKK